MFRYREAVSTRQIDNKLALLQICQRYPIVLPYTCSDYLSIRIVTLQCERIGCSKLNLNKFKNVSSANIIIIIIKNLAEVVSTLAPVHMLPLLVLWFRGSSSHVFDLLRFCFCGVYNSSRFKFSHLFSPFIQTFFLTLFSYEMFIWPPTAATLKSLL